MRFDIIQIKKDKHNIVCKVLVKPLYACDARATIKFD